MSNLKKRNGITMQAGIILRCYDTILINLTLVKIFIHVRKKAKSCNN